MENSPRLNMLQDLIESHERLTKKNQILDEKLDKMLITLSELIKSVLSQAQNKPVQAINTNEIANSMSNSLKVSISPIVESFKGISDKIDKIPKTIEAKINWVTFPMKGWRMLAFWIVFTFCTAIAANYRIVNSYFNQNAIITHYEEQIKKLKEKNPETAKKYFPNN